MGAALVMCTTLGPLVATQQDGRVSGTIGAARAEGSSARLEVTHGGVRLWEGPLSGLEPEPPSPDTGALLAATHAAAAGAPLCDPRRVRVGAWPDPLDVPDGSRVVWRTPSDLLIRTETGVTHLLTLPADRALAEALASEVPWVWWKEGWLLAADGQRPPVADAPVTPAAAVPGLARLLGLVPLPAATLPVPPQWRDGAEVAAMVDEVRSQAGLAPLAWDQGLAEAALQHAAYLTLHEPAPQTHRQEPGDPWFVGTFPEERGGSREILLRLGSATPEEVLVQWLAAPFHRMSLLHPGATHVGVAHVGRSWVAEVRVDEGVPLAGGWPTDGVVVPMGRFDGHEEPDPLPAWRYPDVSWPVGWPITVWGAPRSLEATLSCDGVAVRFHVADAALGTPREAVHLIPRAPLSPGVACAWTATWSVLTDPPETSRRRTPAPVPTTSSRRERGSFHVAATSTATVALPAGLEAWLSEVDARRQELGIAPLAATADAAARARLLSARTRAMREGLAPRRVPGLAGGEPDDPRPVQVCTRPDEPFELDDTWLDASRSTVGFDDRAVVVTWSTGRSGPAASLADPRICAWLFPASGRGQP